MYWKFGSFLSAIYQVVMIVNKFFNKACYFLEILLFYYLLCSRKVRVKV